MSNTRLIYVSKETAEISNDNEGSFTNNVDDGIVVKVGDEVSVEAIAINSVGVGAEIIEIPKRIKNYNYKTNAMAINGAYYIHHNQYPISCMMPLNGHNSVNSTQTDKEYGYMILGAGFPPTIPIKNTKSKYGGTTMNKTLGNRFYLGSYIFAEGQDPMNPIINPIGGVVADTNNAVPSIGVMEFFRTDILFEVDTGYDNPANIANKITQDFHAGNATPQTGVFDSNGGALQADIFPALNGVPFAGDTISQAEVHTKNTACMNMYANTLCYNNDALEKYSLYQSGFAFQNPFYAYYGSRLLCPNTSLGGSGAKATGWLGLQGVVNVFDNNLYQLSDLDNNAGATNVAVDTLYEFNLPYTYDNCVLLAKFIHSQKQLPTGAVVNTAGLRSLAVKNQTYTFINIGRVDDGSVSRATLIPLDAPTGIPAGSAKFTPTFGVKTFYDNTKWGKSKLSAGAEAQGFKIVYDTIVSDANGRQYNSQELNRDVLDAFIIPVQTQAGEIVCSLSSIGFISGDLFVKYNYAVIDLGFYNENNPTCLICADATLKGAPNPPTSIGDYQNTIQIGAPEINMLFDSVRGRFALENMSWANIVDNGTLATANPSAGQPAIKVNYLPPAFYGDVSKPQSIAFCKYAQSGIGILGLSVVDDEYNLELIDPTNKTDVKEKYSNSLLKRLGFSIDQLTNSFGKPDAIFTQRTYESNKPFKGAPFFPYPLTNNIRFDTSIDMGLSSNTSALPMFNLFNTRGESPEISSVSDRCYALALPRKLENPFWLIQSDIIDGVDFNSEKTGGGKQNVVAVCNRAYLAGDFAFSFSTSYAFKATKEFVITGIKTAILNPDLTPADINDATTIIYKVVSPIPFFQQQEEAEQAQALKKAKKK